MRLAVGVLLLLLLLLLGRYDLLLVLLVLLGRCGLLLVLLGSMLLLVWAHALELLLLVIPVLALARDVSWAGARPGSAVPAVPAVPEDC